jgi:hypothetical protein
MDALKIVVIDSGFVYVGYPEKVDHPILGQAILVKKAKNIRVWGTTKGLGELANMGKTSDTILDYVGTITVPFSKLLHFIDIQPQVEDTFK